MDIQNVVLQIEKEYKEFTTQRVKWKADFMQAKNKQVATLQ